MVTLPEALTAPAPRRERTVVSADGSPLHVEEFGPAHGPAVVLAHGWTCAIAFWAPVIRQLVADGRRVIAYDQRGHGRSPVPAGPGACSRTPVCGMAPCTHARRVVKARRSPLRSRLSALRSHAPDTIPPAWAADDASSGSGPCGYGTEQLADDLCAVLDATLAEGEQAVVGGHSMGGMTIMAAARRPQLRQKAAALMLCSTGADRLVPEARVVPLRPAGLRTRVQRSLLGSSAPLGPVTPAARAILRYGTMGPGTPREKVEMCARIVHACPRRARAAWAHVLDALDVSDGPGALTQPTAVVVGTVDRLTPPPHAHRIAAALPHCTGLTELTGAGHMTPVEAPEAVAAVLGGLVRDHLTATPPTSSTVTEERA
jgi:pimeloyl-ACP methyl ester carboxylesterase